MATGRDRLRTAEGTIECGVPQVAGRAEPFVSGIRAGLAGQTAELERLAVELFARGLNRRVVETALGFGIFAGRRAVGTPARTAR